MKTQHLWNEPNCSISFAFIVLLQSMHGLYIPHFYYILDILDYWPLLSSYYNYCPQSSIYPDSKEVQQFLQQNLLSEISFLMNLLLG